MHLHIHSLWHHCGQKPERSGKKEGQSDRELTSPKQIWKTWLQNPQTEKQVNDDADLKDGFSTVKRPRMIHWKPSCLISWSMFICFKHRKSAKWADEWMKSWMNEWMNRLFAAAGVEPSFPRAPSIPNNSCHFCGWCRRWALSCWLRPSVAGPGLPVRWKRSEECGSAALVARVFSALLFCR